mmetsp:Transcript_30197/g.87941  ORF Transcript_30197/g.87941 Transcript_30197/m.87941 type:complete len:809 (-) Transcript_30197:140-2566(-)
MSNGPGAPATTTQQASGAVTRVLAPPPIPPPPALYVGMTPAAEASRRAAAPRVPALGSSSGAVPGRRGRGVYRPGHLVSSPLGGGLYPPASDEDAGPRARVGGRNSYDPLPREMGRPPRMGLHPYYVHDAAAAAAAATYERAAFPSSSSLGAPNAEFSRRLGPVGPRELALLLRRQEQSHYQHSQLPPPPPTSRGLRPVYHRALPPQLPPRLPPQLPPQLPSQLPPQLPPQRGGKREERDQETSSSFPTKDGSKNNSPPTTSSKPATEVAIKKDEDGKGGVTRNDNATEAGAKGKGGGEKEDATGRDAREETRSTATSRSGVNASGSRGVGNGTEDAETGSNDGSRVTASESPSSSASEGAAPFPEEPQQNREHSPAAMTLLALAKGSNSSPQGDGEEDPRKPRLQDAISRDDQHRSLGEEHLPRLMPSHRQMLAAPPAPLGLAGYYRDEGMSWSPPHPSARLPPAMHHQYQFHPRCAPRMPYAVSHPSFPPGLDSSPFYGHPPVMAPAGAGGGYPPHPYFQDGHPSRSSYQDPDMVSYTLPSHLHPAAFHRRMHPSYLAPPPHGGMGMTDQDGIPIDISPASSSGVTGVFFAKPESQTTFGAHEAVYDEYPPRRHGRDLRHHHGVRSITPPLASQGLGVHPVTSSAATANVAAAAAAAAVTMAALHTKRAREINARDLVLDPTPGAAKRAKHSSLTNDDSPKAGAHLPFFRWKDRMDVNLKIKQCLERHLARGTQTTYAQMMKEDPQFWDSLGSIKPDNVGRHLRDIKNGRKEDRTGVFTSQLLRRLWVTLRSKKSANSVLNDEDDE